MKSKKGKEVNVHRENSRKIAGGMNNRQVAHNVFILFFDCEGVYKSKKR
jgi:hypothetical protein